MAEYRCTWWEDTGLLTPSDDRGICRCIYRNLDSGEESSDLPIGALFAQHSGPVGSDGLSVICVIPSSHYKRGKTYWYIDRRATNCTMKDDKEHRCWVRHGTVGDAIHVDKNGNTCAAGAGSIAVPGFHGFLHNGVLRDC